MKKGIIATVFVWVMSIGAASAIIGAALLRPQYIINKANDKCVSLGQSKEECALKVTAMSKEERLAYIKDDQIPADRGFAK